MCARVDGSGFFVRGVADGRFCTWQVSSQAAQWLVANGFSDGDQIPDWVFYPFVQQSHFYTHGTGPGPEADPIQLEPGSGTAGCGTGCLVALVLMFLVGLLGQALG